MQIHVEGIQPGQFRDADAGGIQGFENGPVAQVGQALIRHGVQKVEHVVHGQIGRNPFILFRRQHPLGRIARDHPLAHEKPEKRPHRRQFAGNRGLAVLPVQHRQIAPYGKVVHLPGIERFRRRPARFRIFPLGRHQGGKFLQIVAIGPERMRRIAFFGRQGFQKHLQQRYGG